MNMNTDMPLHTHVTVVNNRDLAWATIQGILVSGIYTIYDMSIDEIRAQSFVFPCARSSPHPIVCDNRGPVSVQS